MVACFKLLRSEPNLDDPASAASKPRSREQRLLLGEGGEGLRGPLCFRNLGRISLPWSHRRFSGVGECRSSLLHPTLVVLGDHGTLLRGNPAYFPHEGRPPASRCLAHHPLCPPGLSPSTSSASVVRTVLCVVCVSRSRDRLHVLPVPSVYLQRAHWCKEGDPLAAC